MKIELEREECLACILALDKIKKPGGWHKSALKKLLKYMGMRNE